MRYKFGELQGTVIVPKPANSPGEVQVCDQTVKDEQVITLFDPVSGTHVL